MHLVGEWVALMVQLRVVSLVLLKVVLLALQTGDLKVEMKVWMSVALKVSRSAANLETLRVEMMES